MFYRLKEMLYRFMYGRYGNDALGNFLFILYFIISVVNIFISSIILYLLSLATVFFIFFRMFSRNITARSKENQKKSCNNYSLISLGCTGAFHSLNPTC